jgi:oligoendopeptidase F
MNFASPRLAASGQSLMRASLVNSGAGQASAAPDELGELPSWRLTDLYLSPSSEEFRSDLAKAETDAIAFEAKWKGKLKEAAGRTGDQGIGAAVKEFEALDDLMGRIASFAGLTYFSDTSNPAN